MRVVGSVDPPTTRRIAQRALQGLSAAWLVCGFWACDVYRDGLLIKAPEDADAGPTSARSDAWPAAGTAGSPEPSAASGSTCERGVCWWSQTRDDCQSAGFPGLEFRPAVNAAAPDDPTGLDAEIYLGLNSIQMAASAAPGVSDASDAHPFGLDLDAVCTDSVTCRDRPRAVSCSSSGLQKPFDRENCRDNSFAELMATVEHIPEISAPLGLSDGAFNCELWRGGFNLLLRLTGYNGSREDGSVRVDWYTSNGLEAAPTWACPESDFMTRHSHWASDARWSVDAHELTRAVTDPGHLPASRISDPNAYVHEGYLVSRLPDGTLLRFAGDAKPLRGLAMPVHEAVWLGRLTKASDGRWAMSDGLIAGRVRTEDMLRSLRQVGLCKTSEFGAFFDLIATYIAENADVLASGGSAPEQPCDAMSFGIAFSALPVTPGATSRPLEPLIECCAPGVAADACRTACGDGVVGSGEQCDLGIADGLPGACPTSCPPADPCQRRTLQGSGCDADCVVHPIQEPISGDGCCAGGANAKLDSDCGPKCGNGVLEPGESCDPPSACPVCVTDDKCLRVTMTGSADTCDVICNVTVVGECRSEDGCCPENCTHGADNDCSAHCGDGRVEPGTSETCDIDVPLTCPQSCDDGDPCTTDIKTGSAANCNVRCSHWRISGPDC